MRCPACSNLLQTVNTKSAAVDICPNCRGIWFDEGELSPFVGALAQSSQISPEKVRLFKRRDIKQMFAAKENVMNCPRCSHAMKRFNYSYDSNVFLDKCLACGGIWTDAGEVKAIAAYLKENPAVTAVGRELAEITYADHAEEDIEEVAKKTAGFFLFFPRIIVPFGSDTVLKKFPAVTLSLIIFSLLIFGALSYFDYDSVSGTISSMLGDDFYALDMISPIFLVGTPLNLLWAVLFLWIFSGSVEDLFGRGNFLLFFLATATFSALPYIFFNCDLRVLAVIIAGGVSAVVGAHIIFFPMSQIRMFAVYRIVEIPAVVFIGLWFVFLMVSPFLAFASEIPKTAILTPILGFGLGVAVSFYVKNAAESDKYPF